MRKYLLLLFFGCFLANNLRSQGVRPEIGMQLNEVIELQQGLNTLDIQLYNDGEEDFEGYVELVLPNGLRSIGESRIAVQIKAGKKRYLSIKLQSQQLASLKGQQLLVQLRDRAGGLLSGRAVQLSVVERRSVVVMDNSELQYLQEVGDSVYVKLRVLNNGTTDERIRLVLSSPDRLGQREFKVVSLSLYGGQDTVVQVGILVERYMIRLPQYTLRASGLYDNDDVFGNVVISFQNIASNRNFQQMFSTDDLAYSYSRNFVDLQMDQSLGGTRMYLLRSEGTYRMMEGKLNYNLHVNQWGDVLSRPNISNTFLEYEKNNKTYTIGNIQESLEAPFYGRGASFSTRDSLNDRQFSVGAIERSNDLLGYYGAIGNPGMSAFARLVLGNQDPNRKRYEGQLYYDNNRLDSTRSLLWANSFELLDKEKADRIRLTAFTAGGVGFYEGEFLDKVQVEPSAALGLKLVRRTTNDFSYSSDNFYSTPYYTGNRRGALQLIQRVNKTWQKTTYGAGFTYSRYNPTYMSPRFVSQDNSMLKVDMTFYRPLSPFVTLNIQPSYNNEEATYWMMDNRTQLSTQSWQLLSSANIRSKNYRHSLYASIETGLLAIEGFSSGNFIMRNNLTYNYRRFGLSAMYQHGAFRVFEVLNEHLLDQSLGSRLMLSSSYRGTLLNGKMTWSGNIASHISSSYGNTYSAGLLTEYRLLKNTTMTGNLRYSYTDGLGDYQYDFTNIRLGVRQNLRSQNLNRPAVRTGNLAVFCYYDNNHNNVFDKGDEIAEGYNFLVGGINFVTDRKGRAEFKKLPYGERVLFFPTSKGYQGLSRVVDIQSKSVSVAIPLQKVSMVKGSLLIRYDVKLSADANMALDLYTIVARDQNNNTFEVRTDQHGEFILALPQGEYNIFIKGDTFPDNIFSGDNLRTVRVEIGKNIELKPFVLQVRKRAIEIKRFGN